MKKSSVWTNASGYYDPTMGAALSRLIREERLRDRQQNSAHQNEQRSNMNRQIQAVTMGSSTWGWQ